MHTGVCNSKLSEIHNCSDVVIHMFMNTDKTKDDILVCTMKREDTAACAAELATELK